MTRDADGPAMGMGGAAGGRGGAGVAAGPAGVRAGPPHPLLDAHGRRVNSIRISVNWECALSCFYCHREGNARPDGWMTTGELESLARVASGLGIRRVKLTGGEPLERGDIVEVVRRLSPLFEEVSMTTNGVRLAPLAAELRRAGLRRVNVSLNSLRGDRYGRICGEDRVAEAVAGVEAALSAGLRPVKLNMVLLRGINEDEVDDLLAFAAARGAVLQVIELETERERVSTGFYADHHADMAALEAWLRPAGRPNGANPLHNRRRYVLTHLPGGGPLPAPVEVELVAPMHNSTFCANCTRIRLTAEGRVKGCLFDAAGSEDLLGPLRAGATEAELGGLVRRVVGCRRPYWEPAHGAGGHDGGAFQ